MTIDVSPLVSIVTVVRNGASHIERCLQSVTGQSYRNVEYLVLDGDSDDGTQEIISRYEDAIAYYQSEPDNGPYDAAMQAISRARGKLIGFVMADDWLSGDAVESVARMYMECPEADLFCFGMQEYRQLKTGTLVETRRFVDPAGDQFTTLEGMYCHGVNRFYSARLLRHNAFNHALYPQMADRDLYIRLGLQKVRKATSRQILYHFTIHPKSKTTGGSRRHVASLLKETVRISADYLSDSGISKADRRLFVRWYCFNQLRLCWFLLRSGQPLRAITAVVSTFIRYPVQLMWSVVTWRIPHSLRPTRTMH